LRTKKGSKKRTAKLAAKLNKDIKSCGLFIDYENPCLGTSSDGLIDENGLIEIKCLLSAEHLIAEEVLVVCTSSFSSLPIHTNKLSGFGRNRT